MTEQERRITNKDVWIDQDNHGISIKFQHGLVPFPEVYGFTRIKPVEPLTTVIHVVQGKSVYPGLHEIHRIEPNVLPRVIDSLVEEKTKDGITSEQILAVNHAIGKLEAIVFPDGKPEAE